MKIAKPKKQQQIKLNMTSMIDIVFQLLVFFIMTFKIVTMEGDFNVRMPVASEQPEQAIDDVLPNVIIVKLLAGEEGRIAGVEVDNGLGDFESFQDADMFTRLTNFVESSLQAEGDPTESPETEVEFDIDFDLKYSYTVKAIESVSGKFVDGKVKKLIEKIKFKDNSNE